MFPGDELVPKQMQEEAALAATGRTTDVSKCILPRYMDMIVTQIKKHYVCTICSSEIQAIGRGRLNKSKQHK